MDWQDRRGNVIEPQDNSRRNFQRESGDRIGAAARNR